MTRLLVAALLASTAACGGTEEPSSEPAPVAIYDRPHTFWYAADADLLPAIECATARIAAATCLDIAAVEDAHHQVLIDSRADMGGLTGRVNGYWTDTRIRVREDVQVAQRCNILVHEIGEHVLRMSNDHAVSSRNTVLTETLVTSICETQRCGCFAPEG